MTDGIPLPSSDSEVELSKVVEAAKRRPFTAGEIATLALHLAESGHQLSWPVERGTADLASTGGPGSLSTLVAPLFLVALGRDVVKLAVPGRPAGAIDALATVPGYRVRLTREEIVSVLSKCRYAHFLADARFAPLDAALYSFRRRVGAVAIPALAAASLLSKKVAVGVKSVGLDVRVGQHGNFGSTRIEAMQNAWLFCTAARQLGIEATAFISSSVPPSQPWIGRGESLVALAVAIGALDLQEVNPWLQEHITECRLMALETGGIRDAARAVSTSDLQDALRGHIVAQGAKWGSFLDRAQSVLAASRRVLVADTTGIVSYDLDVIRGVLVDLQGPAGSNGFSDPAGMELLVRPGSVVQAGEVVARLRCEAGAPATEDLVARIRTAVKILPNPVTDTHTQLTDSPAMEIVRA